MLATTIDLPDEAVLPAMEPCLDAPTVLDACREQLSRVDRDVRATWREARRIEALYHPQRYLRVVYALLDDPSTPANRFWPEGQLVYLQTPIRAPMSRRGQVLSISRNPVEAYCFPNDRRLRGLRTFAGREASARIWQEWAAPAQPDFAVDAASLQRLLVRYVPEQKWIVRLRAEWRQQSNGSTQKQRIAVRSAAAGTCAALRRRHEALARASTTQDASFVVPDVLGARPEHGLLAVEWIRGESLIDVLKSHDPDEIMRGIALRLQWLHATKVPGLRPVQRGDLEHRMSSAVHDLMAACPELEGDMASLAHDFARRLEERNESPRATLHNDFHWKQLSIKRDRFALLDLERMGEGDPLLDVANFATQLQMLGHRPELSVDADAAQRWRAAFLEHWTARADRAIDRRSLFCYAALSRMELARGMMRHLRPGWRALAQQCVALAVTDLDRTAQGDLPT